MAVEETTQSNWGKLKPKMTFIGYMLQHLKCTNENRQDLHRFLREMKKEEKLFVPDEDEIEIRRGERYHSRRQSEVEIQTFVRYTQDKDNIQLETVDVEKHNKKRCDLCKQLIFKANHELWYPCRICDRVFHKQCVVSRNDINQIDKDMIDKALTNTGWSCHNCGDITLLLTDREIAQLIEDFDSFDIGTDCRLKLSDYLAYKRQIEDLDVHTNDGPDIAEIQFKLIDLDGDGTINWWEFLSHESKRMLCNRSQDELVAILSEKEVLEAKAVFQKIDTRNKGYITEEEASFAFKKWYDKFRTSERRDSLVIEQHTSVATQMVMEHCTNKKGKMSWEDFLCGQALYIICSRPNRKLKIATKKNQ